MASRSTITVEPKGPERKLFRRLVVDLHRDQLEVMRVLAFWMWLREIGRGSVDIVRHVLLHDDSIVGSMISEALACISWMQSLLPPPPPSMKRGLCDIPLTGLTIGQKDLSFYELYELRDMGIRRIDEIMDMMRTTDFRDIIVNVPSPLGGNIIIPEGQDVVTKENVSDVIVQMDGPITQPDAPVVPSSDGGLGLGSFNRNTFEVGGPSSAPTEGEGLSDLHAFEVGGPSSTPTRDEGLIVPNNFKVGSPSWATTRDGEPSDQHNFEVGGPSSAPAGGEGIIGGPSSAPAGSEGLIEDPSPAPAGGEGLIGDPSSAPAGGEGLIGDPSSAPAAGEGLSGVHNFEVGGPSSAPTGGEGFSGIHNFEVGGPSSAPAGGEGFSSVHNFEVGGPSSAPAGGEGLAPTRGLGLGGSLSFQIGGPSRAPTGGERLSGMPNFEVGGSSLAPTRGPRLGGPCNFQVGGPSRGGRLRGPLRVGGPSWAPPRGQGLSAPRNFQVGGPLLAPLIGRRLSSPYNLEVGGPSRAPTRPEALSGLPNFEVLSPSLAPTRGEGLSRFENVSQQGGVVPLFASGGSGLGVGLFTGSTDFPADGGPSFTPRIGEGLSRYGNAPQGGILGRQAAARRGNPNEVSSMVQFKDQITETHNIAPAVSFGGGGVSFGGGGGGGLIGLGAFSGPIDVGGPSLAPRRGRSLARSGNINDEIDSRTMYFTFTRENPVTLAEFRDYFNSLYGSESIDSIFMQQAREIGEPPLFARIVFCSIDTVQSIFAGNEKVEFAINGKAVWTLDLPFL